MFTRRMFVLVSLLTTAACFFLLGAHHARTGDVTDRAAYDSRLDAIRAEVRAELQQENGGAAGTTGALQKADSDRRARDAARAKMVAEIKQELQSEMGLLPVRLLRERRSSFVELYSSDSFGKTNYGTAGYLGGGYF